MVRHTKYTKGIGLVEVVVGIGIFVAAVVAIIGGFRFFLSVGFANLDNVKAQFLLEEGFEAVRAMRDTSYDPNITDLIGAGTYYLEFTDSTWATTTTATLIDGRFTRTISLSEVHRDSNDDIVASGGTVDPNTVEVTVAVAWDRRGITATKSVTGYVTNLFE